MNVSAVASVRALVLPAERIEQPFEIAEADNRTGLREELFVELRRFRHDCSLFLSKPL
jgi:hypothetical protein